MFVSGKSIEYGLDCVSAKGVVFARKNKILLLRKADGKWDLPGGKRENGEGVYDCLVRETYEETGLKVDAAEWLGKLRRLRSDGSQILKAVFVCQLECEPKKSLITLSKEHIEGEFFGMTKISDLALTEEYANVISLAAQKVGILSNSPSHIQ